MRCAVTVQVLLDKSKQAAGCSAADSNAPMESNTREPNVAWHPQNTIISHRWCRPTTCVQRRTHAHIMHRRDLTAPACLHRRGRIGNLPQVASAPGMSTRLPYPGWKGRSHPSCPRHKARTRRLPQWSGAHHRAFLFPRHGSATWKEGRGHDRAANGK